MTYDEALEYLNVRVGALGSVLGLDNMKELLRRLNQPQEQLKYIHIAGTNGKGSVGTFISEALIANGYRVGRYVSPSVVDYREKIQVNGKFISKAFVTRTLEELFRISEEMVLDGLAHPTMFELETAMAFLYFAEKKCDLVILECGLGGETDATNVIPAPKVAVFTEIGMDHMAILGNTPAEIATVKAGIIKPGSRVASAPQLDTVKTVLEEKCKAEGVSFVSVLPEDMKPLKESMKGQRFRYKDYPNVCISLLGNFQRENASLALLALELLAESGIKLRRERILQGFKEAKWPGRFEILGTKPYVIADGAHNEAAVRKLMASMEMYFTNRRIVYIMGILKDKDYTQMIEDSLGLAEYIVTVTPPIKERALSAMDLAMAIRTHGVNVTAADSVEEALEEAMLLAGEDGVVLAFGSLSYLGVLREAYTRIKKSQEGKSRNGGRK